MKVFVTGASGFIGSHVTRALLASGHDVAALRRSSSVPRRLEDVADRVLMITGDLAHVAGFRQALAAWKPEASVHLAWYAEPGAYLESPVNLDCLAGSLALVRLLGDLGCRRAIMAGTCAEYDRTAGVMREDTPTRPETLYAACKLALKVAAEPFAAAHGIGLVWARVFFLYGPDEDQRRLVPAAIRAMLRREGFPTTSGLQQRDYLHVHDVASALVSLLASEAVGVFNVASGTHVAVRELLETVADLAGGDHRRFLEFGALQTHEWEPMLMCGDNGRLVATGWAPRYDLREGLRQTLEWWKALLEGGRRSGHATHR